LERIATRIHELRLVIGTGDIEKLLGRHGIGAPSLGPAPKIET
jgi:hypothetical protein